MPRQLTLRQQRIMDFLVCNPVGVLSTCVECEPHGVVIYHSIDENFEITFLTKRGTRKYHNLKNNPRVMLTVYEAQSQSTAQVSGSAIELNDAESINKVAGSNLNSSLKSGNSGLPPIVKLEAGIYAAFVIRPQQIHMASYNTSRPTDYTELFDSIESFELQPV